MTKYMISVWHEEGEEVPSDEVIKQMHADVGAFNQKVMDAGIWVFGGGLETPDTATVVDGRDEEPVFTDGPYLESKEYIIGFWIVEAPHLDAALRLAAQGSRSCNRRVELRPFLGE